jgi:hypothetical protein
MLHGPAQHDPTPWLGMQMLAAAYPLLSYTILLELCHGLALHLKLSAD